MIGGANVDRKAKSLANVVAGTSNPAVVLESHGGVARNVAENLARLGLPVQLLSAVGDDSPGAALLQHAQQAGIDTTTVLRLAGQATGSYTAVLQPGGEMVLAVSDMAVVEQLTPERLLACRPAWGPALLRVMDLNLPASSVALLMEDSRQQGATLVAVAVSEPKMQRLPLRLDGLALIILNQGELAARVGHELADAQAVKQACRQLQLQGVQEVVVTMGALGVVACPRQGEPALLGAGQGAATVVDVTGAGDAFAAGVVAALYRSREAGAPQSAHDLRAACALGLRLAALTIGSVATVAPTLTPAFWNEGR